LGLAAFPQKFMGDKVAEMKARKEQQGQGEQQQSHKP
jgi:hypothetical protein